ncbi:acyltransferase family protein [Nostoc sp.]|uniref:acyltransferase family protein n=1 Tax=Nostoc sp. TaxID=1180 RepID=UPI002FFB2C82
MKSKISMTSTSLSYQARLNSIDALRGLAALTVVFYHARPMFWVGLGEIWKQYGLSIDINSWLGYATAPLYFGGLAVNLFFIISGYCIHRRGAQQLISDCKTSLNLKQYAIRRIWRIYPTYIAALLITALVDTYVRTHYPAEVDSRQSNSLFTFIMSLLALPGLAAPYFGSNTVFWTLALEIHFYIVYPILFYISRKYGVVKTLALTFTISLIYISGDFLLNLSDLLPYRGSGNPIFLPFLFTWTFGFYLAEVEAGRAALPKRYWLIATLGVIIVLIASLFELSSLVAFSSTLPLGGLLYWSIKPQGNKFWSCKLGSLFTKLGLFSYSLYAIHRPVLLFIKISVAPLGERFLTLIPTLSASSLAVLVAWFFFLLVEKRTLKPIG